jgi:hypothetical protein
MTAEGKRTATRLAEGDRVLLIRREAGLVASTRLTGADVITAQVIGEVYSVGNRRVAVPTTAGDLIVVGHQTLTLAPETPAAIARAYAEAVAEDATRTPAEPETPAGPTLAEVDDAYEMHERWLRHARIIAAGKAGKRQPELFPVGTRVLTAVSSRGGHPLDLTPGVIVDVYASTMVVRDDDLDTDAVIDRYVYVERDERAYAACTGPRTEQTLGRRREHAGPLSTWLFRNGERTVMCDAHGYAYGDLGVIAAPALRWRTVRAGHYVAGPDTAEGFTVRRDASASEANRWSVRHDGKRVSGHRLVKHAKAAAQRLADAEAREMTAAITTPDLPGMHGEPEHYRQQAGTATPTVESESMTAPDNTPTPAPETGSEPVSPVAEPVMSDTGRQFLADELVEMLIDGATLEGTPEGWFAVRPDGHRTPVYNSVVVLAGVRGDIVHDPADSRHPRLRPLRVDDVVTVDPLRRSRQYDVIDDGTGHPRDGLVRVMPRHPREVEDGPRWVSREYVYRVPGTLIEPVEDDQADGEVAAGPIARFLDARTSAAAHQAATGIAPPVDEQPVTCDGCGTQGPRSSMHRERVVDMGSSESVYTCRNCEPDHAERITTTTAARRAELRETPAMAADERCVDAVASTGATVHVVVDGSGLVGDGHDVDQCPRGGPSLADSLRKGMPDEYRRVLAHLLTPHGFAATPEGGDPVVVAGYDDANPEASMIHEPTGLTVGMYERYVRLAYPAEHGGAPDEDLGPAYVDLEYGTSFETVVDVAVGLTQRLMRQAHLDHMHGVADRLREMAGPPANRSIVMSEPRELRKLADQLAAANTECKAAGFARRVTALLNAVMTRLVDLGQADRVDGETLRHLALLTAEALTMPEPTVEQLVEHLRQNSDAAIVADESVTPADVDSLVDQLVAFGWQQAGEPEYVAGKRVRYLTPPAAVAAGLHGESTYAWPGGSTPFDPGTGPQVGYVAGDCGHRVAVSEWNVGLRTCERCPGRAGGADLIAAVDDDRQRRAAGLTSCAVCGEALDDDNCDQLGTHTCDPVELADDDSGVPLSCGCDPSQRDHTCGPSAPDTFDPSSEV